MKTGRINKIQKKVTKTEYIMKRLTIVAGIILFSITGAFAQGLKKQKGNQEVRVQELPLKSSEVNFQTKKSIGMPGFQTIDPFKSIWEKTTWPNAKINFEPLGVNLPAGDLNGDGTTDLYRNYNAVPDERDAGLENTTDKTLIYWGSNTLSTTHDMTIYSRLQFVGNIYGEGNDNAVSYNEAEGQWYIYNFTNNGFTKEPLNNEFFNQIFSAERIVYNDLNDDGYDDIVVVNRSEGLLHILFGGETLQDLELKTQNVNNWASVNSFNITQTNLTDVYTYKDSSYIVLATVDLEVSESRTAIIASVSDTGELHVEQTFQYSSNASNSGELLQARVLNPNEAPYLVWVFPDESLTYIFAPSENGEQMFEPTPQVWIELLSKPIGDLDNDGRTDFIVQEVGGDLRYLTSSDDPKSGPAFGELVAESSSLNINFALDIDTPFLQRLSYDDITGNGNDDYFLRAENEDSFGQILIEGNEDRNFTTTALTYSIANYSRTFREDTYPLGDITGNGMDDFAVLVLGTASEQDKINIYEGGSSFDNPKSTIKTNNEYIIDVSAGVFKETGRQDIAILTFQSIQDSEQGTLGQTQVEIYAGGGVIASTPYITITDHDAYEGYDWLDNIFGTLATAGDVTNSGYDDLLIGAPTATDNDDGSSFPTVLYEGGPNMDKKADHYILYKAEGSLLAGTWFANSMSGVGDINGDGIDDFAISSTNEINREEYYGVVHVYFGQDGENKDVSFGEADLSLLTNPEDAQNNVEQSYLGFSEIAAGDFNGNGYNDIAVKTFRHRDIENLTQGYPGIHIYNGGPQIDSLPDKMVGLYNDVMSITERGAKYVPSMGHLLMQAVPDIDGSGHDELLVIGDNGYTNGVLLMGSNNSIKEEPATVLEAPNKSIGMGSVGAFTNRHYKTAIGDFTGDGFQDVAVVQRNDRNFRGTPVYLFSTGDAMAATTFGFQVKLSVEDSTENHMDLLFGTSEKATTGAGPLDQEAPPMPPASSFDARFMQGATGYFVVYHQTTEESNQWDLTIKPQEEAYPVTVSWNPEALASEGAFTLAGEGIADINMREKSSVTLMEDDPGQLQITHVMANEVPAIITLLSPNDGVDLETDSLIFTWNKGGSTVKNYSFELAHDAKFTDILVDSSISDTSFIFKEVNEETELYWRVRAENSVGWGEYSSERSLTWIPTSVEQQAGIPLKYGLENNYPNPFNPSTVIGYQLPENSRVQLEVYDILGKKVAMLVNERQQAGSYQVNFDASQLSSGVYIYRIRAGEFSQIKQMILIK